MDIFTILILMPILALLYHLLSHLLQPNIHHLKYVHPDGARVQLINNPNASDQTYDKVVQFIRADTTNTKPYVFGKFVCSNFAEIVHNNAEAAGIRCAWVAVDFENGVPSHSCNAFNTSDRGIIFFDCTGTPNPIPNRKPDFTVDIRIGKLYELIPIENDPSLYCPPMGKVRDFSLYW
jgi:hypothetical protein